MGGGLVGVGVGGLLGPTEYTDDLGQKQSGKLTVQGVYMIWKKFYSMEAQILCMPGWRCGGEGGGGGGLLLGGWLHWVHWWWKTRAEFSGKLTVQGLDILFCRIMAVLLSRLKLAGGRALLVDVSPEHSGELDTPHPPTPRKAELIGMLFVQGVVCVVAEQFHFSEAQIEVLARLKGWGWGVGGALLAGEKMCSTKPSFTLSRLFSAVRKMIFLCPYRFQQD